MAMGRGKRGDFAKKKKKRNCGFPGVFNMREMRKTRETKVTQGTGKRWHPRRTCGHGVGEGERAVNWESGSDIRTLPCVR